MKNISKFLRSILPADPWQLLLLAGAIFLFISPRLSWIPVKIAPTGAEALSTDPGDIRRLVTYLILLLIPLACAGIAAYYACFWPSTRPVLRNTFAVLIPALLTLVALLYEFFRLNRWPDSVLRFHPGPRFVLSWFSSNAGNFPTGVYICTLGLLMAGAFTVRLNLGLTSLPLSIYSGSKASPQTIDSWFRIKLLVFFLVCPLVFLQLVSNVLLFISQRGWSRMFHSSSGVIYEVLAEFLAAFVLVVASVLILGRGGRRDARASVRLPVPYSLLIALALPIGISYLISCFAYSTDRMEWVASWLSRSSPPVFGPYFDVGLVWHASFLLMIFAAFAEEVVFRGLLLRKLMLRYGSYRGIFVTGLIWAAFHFYSDANMRLSVSAVLAGIVLRVLICLPLNFVLSWMTLRWNSVIPGGIAHTVSNILIVSKIDARFSLHYELRIALWALAALVLFRYWPVAPEGELFVGAAADPEIVA